MKCVIIGGGIGGLTTAIALQQKGVEVKVREAAPEIKAIGAGIWMATNAMQIFDRLGLAQRVTAEGISLEKVSITDRQLRILSAMDIPAIKKRYGHSIVAIHRATLQQLLIGSLAPGTLETGKRCESFTEDDAGIRIRYTDQSEEAADLLIGADGIHSVIREQMFPEAKLRYAGQTCWRGVSNHSLEDRFKRSTIEAWGGRYRFGFSEIADDKVYWFAVQATRPGGKDNPGTIKADLLSAYQNFAPTIGRIIHHTSGIIRNDLMDLRPLGQWYLRRICLIGDAAHAATPNMGQGGAQAIEDAWVLADQISRYDQPEQAFRRYQQIRMPKARFVVSNSRRIGSMAHLAKPWAQLVRNGLMKLMPRQLAGSRLHRVWAIDY